MGHYKSNLRDIEFTLFEVLGRDQILGSGPYADLDLATARGLLSEIEALATNELADAFEVGDRTPPVYDPATRAVTMPPKFAAAFRAYMDSGWAHMDLPESLGGTPTPPSLRWAIAEMVLGSNPGVHMYSSGPAFSHVFWALGTDEQKEWARVWAQKQWGATMVLTEPDAGSDVGAGRTKAIRQDDGSWHIEGVKRFITERRLRPHRRTSCTWCWRAPRAPGRAPRACRCSSSRSSGWRSTGELRSATASFATKVEHKMGMQGLGDLRAHVRRRRACRGLLVGEVHDGIAQMFHVIEYARMAVGTKSMATLSTAYLNALEYTHDASQGADLDADADKTAPRVAVIHHPDVRRMLMTQKALRRGPARARAVHGVDPGSVRIKEAAGEDTPTTTRSTTCCCRSSRATARRRSYELLADVAAVLRRLGLLPGLPDRAVHPRLRRSTRSTRARPHIQALDLFFRKIVRNNFAALHVLAGQVSETAKGGGAGDALARERELLGQAVEDVQAMVGTMAGYALESTSEVTSVYKVGQNTTRLLFALGDVVVAWLLLRQAEVALAALPTASERDRDFYAGKVAAARFFAGQVLPVLAAHRQMVESTDTALMDLPESAF